MPSVSMCFYLHHPVVMKPYSIFDLGSPETYWDWERWEADFKTIEAQSLQPCLEIWEEWAKKGNTSFSLYIPGFLVQRMVKLSPTSLKKIQKLVKKGTISMLSGTYSYSYAFLSDREAFTEQIKLHEEVMDKYFGGCSKIFFSPGWLYNNLLGFYLKHIGMQGVIAEGSEEMLNGRNPNKLYHVMHTPDLTVFLRDRKLCMNVMHDMGNRHWEAFPLTVEKYASWIHYLANIADNVSLCFPLQTFGLLRKSSEGIFDFLKRFPAEVMKRNSFSFESMETVRKEKQPSEVWDVTDFVTEHPHTDMFRANSRQVEAMESLLKLRETYGENFSPEVKEDWLLLQQVDHLQRMHTDYNLADISGYPYEQISSAYAYYMQAVSDLELRLKKGPAPKKKSSKRKPKKEVNG